MDISSIDGFFSIIVNLLTLLALIFPFLKKPSSDDDQNSNSDQPPPTTINNNLQNNNITGGVTININHSSSPTNNTRSPNLNRAEEIKSVCNTIIDKKKTYIKNIRVLLVTTIAFTLLNIILNKLGMTSVFSVYYLSYMYSLIPPFFSHLSDIIGLLSIFLITLLILYIASSLYYETQMKSLLNAWGILDKKSELQKVRRCLLHDKPSLSWSMYPIGSINRFIKNIDIDNLNRRRASNGNYNFLSKFIFIQEPLIRKTIVVVVITNLLIILFSFRPDEGYAVVSTNNPVCNYPKDANTKMLLKRNNLEDFTVLFSDKHIELANHICFIPNESIEEFTDDAFVNTQNLNIRFSPINLSNNFDNNINGAPLPFNTQVKIHKRIQGEWSLVLVKNDNRQGFVATKHLRIVRY